MRPRSGLADNREVVGADLPLDRNGLAVGARTYGKTDEKRGPPSLVVDPRIYAGEIARFTSHVVCGPAASDCSIWTAAIGADGYGRN